MPFSYRNQYPKSQKTERVIFTLEMKTENYCVYFKKNFLRDESKYDTTI